MAESHYLHITESRRFPLKPDHILVVRGVGTVVHSDPDSSAKIKLRAEWQSLGPYDERVTIDIAAFGEVEYRFYDSDDITEAEMLELTMVASGTRVWVKGDGFRTERYWNGSEWELLSRVVVGVGVPDDNDGRPDTTVYVQLP